MKDIVEALGVREVEKHEKIFGFTDHYWQVQKGYFFCFKCEDLEKTTGLETKAIAMSGKRNIDKNLLLMLFLYI